MDTELIDKIVGAVLYEGYLLYPYRPALKNRRRWTFGVVDPGSDGDSRGTPQSGVMTTHCLIQGSAEGRLEVEIRFLHLVDRRAAITRGSSDTVDRDHGWVFVESVEAEGRVWQNWEEAVERRVRTGAQRLGDLDLAPAHVSFAFPENSEVEPLPAPADGMRAALVREQRSIAGIVQLESQWLADDLRQVTVRILNQSIVSDAGSSPGREPSPRQSLLSTHAILSVSDARFLSMIDPPEACREHVARIGHQDLWPVMVGVPGRCDLMLASPIILYDHPQVADESPGDAFDATEMDEMLALRVMTLTDEEKRQMRQLDERAGDLLRRMESLSESHLLNLHGAIRERQVIANDGS